MKTLTTIALTLAMLTPASAQVGTAWPRDGSMMICSVISCWTTAQQDTIFRDSSGSRTGTASTDSQGTTTFRDGSGRMLGTSTTDSGGTTTFRDERGRMISTVTAITAPLRR